jgi:hypothetical protein
MQVISYSLTYTRPDLFKIHMLGDIHGGTVHCDEHLIQRKVKEIQADPKSRWVGVGDYCEFITTKDKRWDVGVISPWLKQNNIARCEEDWFVNLVEPIQDQCIGLVEGNHEIAMRQKFDTDVMNNICKKLGTVNLGYSCLIRLVFNREKSNDSRTYTMMGTHGAGACITPGAKLTRLQRLMDVWDADMIFHGHVHDIIVHVRPYMTLTSALKIQHRVKVAAMTGSYFRTYTQDAPPGYGEIHNYPPNVLGSPVFEITPDKDIIEVKHDGR